MLKNHVYLIDYKYQEVFQKIRQKSLTYFISDNQGKSQMKS